MSGFSTARLKMVDGQVRTNDVTDRRVIDAMLTVPREAFVPAARQALAYLDLDLDVSESAAKRFLIKPQLTGKLLQAAEIAEDDNVLVVGCATGYLAALAAKLARQVTATESDPALAAKAKDALAGLGLTNVSCKVASCIEGDSSAAPYDVIILNGAAEVMPDGLLGQLKEGGRLLGVSAESRPPRAVIVTHTHGEFGHRALFDAAAPVLPGLERAAAFVF
ncbi:protein-L-isoaspartate carboxylmethyltransferase [Bradyrhizobium sp. YR681]|uniref:protein-L-isoaspartate O-methyltransferase family protein n=1 Tax=Bradyrhizobium sp. YR681 TaxID=1144344 RepID=UPI00026F8672|nr:protein-L-isoaspartate O-methyltransferase [Bradyrhizobium sp. YR681]EJN06683.1 protein-L-isoaspartate carboxylmethyltransferase [Bradyrhizobium sp. YR681]